MTGSFNIPLEAPTLHSRNLKRKEKKRKFCARGRAPFNNSGV
jgi:hypothetical protein